MGRVKSIYLKEGKDKCIDYWKQRLKSDLDFVSGGYKRAIQSYNQIVGDGSDPMNLIPGSLIEEHQKAVCEYEKKMKEFISMLYKMPERRCFGSLITSVFFSYLGYTSRGDIICSVFFWSIASVGIFILLRKFIRIFGRTYFDRIEMCFNEIDKKYYGNVSLASNKIENAIIDLARERSLKK